MKYLFFLKLLHLEKIVIVCVTMIFTILLVSNSSYVFSQVGYTLYNNTEFGFQLLYPQNWIAVEGVIQSLVIFKQISSGLSHLGTKESTSPRKSVAAKYACLS